MQREYMGYVGAACKNGMTPEEVQYLFNDIYQKSNTRKGKKVLRLFSQGIGKAKKNVMIRQNTQIAQPVVQPGMNVNHQQELGRQFIYKQQ